MLSFHIAGGRNAATKAAARVKLFVRPTCCGGTQSLIDYLASLEGPETETSVSSLRVSVGLENMDDLIDYLAQAL